MELTSSVSAPQAIETLKRCVLDRLPPLNRSALAGQLGPAELIHAVNDTLLPAAAPPDTLSRDAAMALLVLLGPIGSSVERHVQQAPLRAGSGPAAPPGEGLRALRLPDGTPFATYFAQVADRAEHPHRDTFISYIEHNGPAIDVKLRSTEAVYRLPASFADGACITYTGERGELDFIALLKEAAALQGAANTLIAPAAHDDDPLARHAHALREAAELTLAVGHRLGHFMTHSSFSTDFFLDVLRQFAIPWTPDRKLREPSGANDDSALLRDVLLFSELLGPGPDFAGYSRHVEAVCPILSPAAATRLRGALARPSLDARIEGALERPLATLAALSDAEAVALVRAHPWLSACLALYRAQATTSRIHYASVTHYLVRPKQARDRAGDPREKITVVRNSHGTTHMDPLGVVRALDRARREHPLAALALRRALVAA